MKAEFILLHHYQFREIGEGEDRKLGFISPIDSVKTINDLLEIKPLLLSRDTIEYCAEIELEFETIETEDYYLHVIVDNSLKNGHTLRCTLVKTIDGNYFYVHETINELIHKLNNK